MLPVLLGNMGEVFKSTLLNIKLAGADADRISKLASRLSTNAHIHAEHHSELQSCRSNTSAISSVASQTIRASVGGSSAHNYSDRFLPVEVFGPETGEEPDLLFI